MSKLETPTNPDKAGEVKSSRDYNVGTADYSSMAIQNYDVWSAIRLNPWRADMVKRILRTKEGQKKLDLQKIAHVCDYLIEYPIDDFYVPARGSLDMDLITSTYKLPDWKVKALTIVITVKATDNFKVIGLKLIRSLVNKQYLRLCSEGE